MPAGVHCQQEKSLFCEIVSTLKRIDAREHGLDVGPKINQIVYFFSALPESSALTQTLPPKFD
jgi:hypothetical protein